MNVATFSLVANARMQALWAAGRKRFWGPRIVGYQAYVDIFLEQYIDVPMYCVCNFVDNVSWNIFQM